MSQSVAGRVLSDLVSVYLLILFIRIIADNIFAFAPQLRPQGIVVALLEAVYTVTDPPLKLLRRLIPPLKVGNLALDLSPLLLIIGLYAIQATVLQRI